MKSNRELLKEAKRELRNAEQLLNGGNVHSEHFESATRSHHKTSEYNKSHTSRLSSKGSKPSAPTGKTATGGKRVDSGAAGRVWESNLSGLFHAPESGAAWRAAMRREAAALSRKRDRRGPSSFPPHSSECRSPRPSRSRFVGKMAAGGKIHTCRHVPAPGTRARAIAEQKAVPGSGLPSNYSEDSPVPPVWTTVEVAVAQRRFLRYGDFLQNRDRGNEGIPLWAI